MPATGGSSTILVPHVTCNTSFLPTWSPNSANIAAVANDGRLMVAGTATHSSSAVTGIGIGSVDGFAWSPDSAKLLVAARPFTPSGCSSLWLVTVKTRAARLLRRC